MLIVPFSTEDKSQMLVSVSGVFVQCERGLRHKPVKHHIGCIVPYPYVFPHNVVFRRLTQTMATSTTSPRGKAIFHTAEVIIISRYYFGHHQINQLIMTLVASGSQLNGYLEETLKSSTLLLADISMLRKHHVWEDKGFPWATSIPSAGPRETPHPPL